MAEYSNNLTMRQRAFRGGVLLFTILLGAWWCGAAGFWPRREARLALDAHRLDDAEKMVRRAIQFEGETRENLLLLARVTRKQGELSRFRQILDQAEQAGADQEQIVAEVILAQAQSGDIDAVQSQLDAMLIGGGTDDEEVLEAYVNGCLTAARISQAETLITGWIKTFPESAQPHYYNGRLLLYQERTAEAAAALKKALAAKPDHYAAAYVLGKVLAEDSQHEDALRQFEQALNVTYNAAARIEYARMLTMLARTDEAREILLDVAELDQDAVRISYRRVGDRFEGHPAARALGSLELAAGDHAAALRWLDMAVNANPGDLDARHQRGLALRGVGRTDEAVEELNRVSEARAALREVDRLVDLIETQPGLVEERVRIAELYITHESKLTGEYWLRTALVRDPDHGKALSLLAALNAERTGQVRAIDGRSDAEPAGEAPTDR
ncbi:MAG: tetratricopeptide repeat protein [Planctomycetota bacterium]|jgi:tetratricopeptide (TPR) repeat protein